MSKNDFQRNVRFYYFLSGCKTVKAFAARLEVPYSTVQKWLYGLRVPDVPKQKLIIEKMENLILRSKTNV